LPECEPPTACWEPDQMGLGDVGDSSSSSTSGHSDEAKPQPQFPWESMKSMDQKSCVSKDSSSSRLQAAAVPLMSALSDVVDTGEARGDTEQVRPTDVRAEQLFQRLHTTAKLDGSIKELAHSFSKHEDQQHGVDAAPSMTKQLIERTGLLNKRLRSQGTSTEVQQLAAEQGMSQEVAAETTVEPQPNSDTRQFAHRGLLEWARCNRAEEGGNSVALDWSGPSMFVVDCASSSAPALRGQPRSVADAQCTWDLIVPLLSITAVQVDEDDALGCTFVVRCRSPAGGREELILRAASQDERAAWIAGIYDTICSLRRRRTPSSKSSVVALE